MWREYQTAFGPHHSQMTTSAHSASSRDLDSSCSPSAAHWSTRTSRSGCSRKYWISGVKNFRSCPAMTTRSGAPEDQRSPAGTAADTARARYARSRAAARSSANDAAAADVRDAARSKTAGSSTAAATSATSSIDAANSG